MGRPCDGLGSVQAAAISLPLPLYLRPVDSQPYAGMPPESPATSCHRLN